MAENTETTTKRYLSFDRLKEYDDLIKEEIANSVIDKANSSHTHVVSDITDIQTTLDKLLEDSKTYTNDAISTKAETDHVHEIEEVNGLQEELGSLQTLIESSTAPAGTTLGTVMSGGHVTITDGMIMVQDDSHNHIIDNVDGLQDALNMKSDISHNHDDMYYTEPEVDLKVSEINASITGITSGDIIVGKANHALSADSATAASTAEKAVQDNSGNIITDTYETKTNAADKLSEAKSYADGIKNDLLNGAGEQYDTLKELGQLIDDNHDAIDALEIVASGKAEKVHTHAISDVIDLQTSLDAKQPNITGAATTITSNNLTASRALTTDDSGKVAVSLVTSTELGYLSGATSNIQNQLNGKQATITGTAGQFVVIGTDGNVTTKTVPYAEEATFGV